MFTASMRHDFVWVRRISLAAIALAVVFAAYLFVRYPSLAGDWIFQVLAGIGALVLGLAAFFIIKETRALDRQAAMICRYGVACGLVILALFLLNMLDAVLIDRGLPLPDFVILNPVTFLILSSVVALAGGILISWRADGIASGLRAGLWTALFGGIAIAVALLAGGVLLAPLVATNTQFAHQITAIADQVPVGTGETAFAALCLWQASAVLFLLPVFTVIGGALGDVIGVGLARVGALGRDETRRGRVAARLATARALINGGQLRAAVSDLGAVIDDWLRSTTRLRVETAAPHGGTFSPERALVALRDARAVTRADVDGPLYALHLRDDVAQGSKEPSRDEVENMLAVARRVAAEKVGFAV
jgi:hypothetical protein